MKKDIIKLFPGIKISVIYNGLNTQTFFPVSDVDLSDFRQKFTLPSNFILAVGHLEKRKNYIRLIDSIARLHEWGHNYYLLIIGNDNGQKRLIKERVKSANLCRYVKILSGLSDFEVYCAYNSCNLFVFPSSYEGFGIPVLEAMSAGCPMVLSDIPVFREITQNNCSYFPYDDVDLIAHAIKNAILSNSECNRLVQYGKKRVREFDYDNISLKLKTLYMSLL